MENWHRSQAGHLFSISFEGSRYQESTGILEVQKGS